MQADNNLQFKYEVREKIQIQEVSLSDLNLKSSSHAPNEETPTSTHPSQEISRKSTSDIHSNIGEGEEAKKKQPSWESHA